MVTEHQDYIYLDEDYIGSPKETFKFCYNIIDNYFSKKVKLEVLDLGCAKGEWIYHLYKRRKNSNYLGLDDSPILIKEAKKEFNKFDNVKFINGSAEDYTFSKKFNVINMAGVISYFDNIHHSLKVIRSSLSSDGIAIIFDNFNHFDVDVLINYRNNNYSKTFEKGWNLHSLKTIEKELKKLDLVIDKIERFNLPFDLEKKNDPCRSWTTKIDGKKSFMNGLCQVFDLDAIIIKKK